MSTLLDFGNVAFALSYPSGRLILCYLFMTFPALFPLIRLSHLQEETLTSKIPDIECERYVKRHTQTPSASTSRMEGGGRDRSSCLAGNVSLPLLSFGYTCVKSLSVSLIMNTPGGETSPTLSASPKIHRQTCSGKASGAR